jgi:hypothetical protein
MQNSHTISLEAQRARLLKRLKQGPCSTVEARHQLDILGVATRIYELRHNQGFNIQRFWTREINPGGSTHRVAKYVLLPSEQQNGGN